MQRANALRRAAHACMSTQAGGSIPHSALAYRALLRNLKLLQGMRPKNEFQLLLAGYEAAGAAPIFRSLEPQLRVHIVGDEHGVHAGMLLDVPWWRLGCQRSYQLGCSCCRQIGRIFRQEHRCSYFAAALSHSAQRECRLTTVESTTCVPA